MFIYKCYYEDGQFKPANLGEYTKEEVEEMLRKVEQGHKCPYSKEVLQEELNWRNGKPGYELGPDQKDYYIAEQNYEDNMKAEQEREEQEARNNYI